jgi:hypothetical protein
MRRVTTYEITVVDVIREMGIDAAANPRLCQRVGSMMGDYWNRLTCRETDKLNKPKTNGKGGSHAFCHYPECFRLLIESYVKMCQFEDTRQPLLFAADAFRNRTEP